MAKQPGKGTRTKRERGAYGNKRGKEAQKRRRQVRLRDPRVATTLDQVRAEQAALEARIEREKKQPAVGETAGAKYKPPVVVQPEAPIIAKVDDTPTRPQRQPKKVRIPYDAQGDKGWTLGQARSMVRQGYKVTRVVYMTGWGMKWFEDLPTDDDGYGLSTDDWVATL